MLYSQHNPEGDYYLNMITHTRFPENLITNFSWRATCDADVSFIDGILFYEHCNFQLPFTAFSIILTSICHFVNNLMLFWYTHAILSKGKLW